MATGEDAAAVLDQFCNDVANIPAEITHLLEEITAKDQQIEDLRLAIATRDKSIQNFVRQNGGHVKNPKEDSLTRGILTNYDRVEILQTEKLALSEKMMIVLDRQVKRFDLKLRKLTETGELPADPSMPSLIQPAAGTGAPIAGTPTPLNPLSVNTAQAGGAPNIANAAMARMAASNSTRNSPIAAPNPLLTQPHLNGTAARSQRESSADAAKRRRLNTSTSSAVPAQSSSLRQSSLGPSSGTPKAGTPAPSTSRAGSAQPSRPAISKKPPTNKKIAPHQLAAAAAAASSRKRVRTSGTGPKKSGDRRRNLESPTPSSSRGSTSPTPSSLPQTDGAADPRSSRRHAAGSAGSDDDVDEPEQDAEGDEIYCVCQQVSYGDMVACDNEECPYQWFHWSCVGLKAEPKGDWLCPHCRDLPSDKIVKAKDEK